MLDQLNPSNGQLISSLTVPNSSQGLGTSADQMVTSFSSKSELALNQSTDGNYVTFMGYNAPVGSLDVSNSNTPGAVDPTNSGSTTPRTGWSDRWTPTATSCSPRPTPTAATTAAPPFSIPATTASTPPATPVTAPTRSPRAWSRAWDPRSSRTPTRPSPPRTPGAPTPLGNFNITQLGQKADKSAKDDNFRGLTVNGSVIYTTKGSGSNGVDTVYFVDTTGTACPSGGVGIPSASATLPTALSFSSPTFSTASTPLGLTTSNPGLTPTNMCILKGFPTTLAKSATDSSLYPFGMWFANPTTLYVADEGAGDATYNATSVTYTAAAASTTAGLQKWTFNTTTGQWGLDYTLQGGLNLGVPYSVANDASNDVYPTGPNNTDGGKGSPWSPGTDGLRNLTGEVNPDGTVTIWATTSTVSGAGDQGADPNMLVSINDNLASTTLPPARTSRR